MTRHQTVTPSEQHTPSHGRTHPRTYYRTKERTQARGHTINARILSITLTHTNKITRRPQGFNNLGHTPSHSHNLTRTYTHTHTHAPNIHGNFPHTCTGTIGTGARSGGSSGGSAEGMRDRGWLRSGRATRASRTVRGRCRVVTHAESVLPAPVTGRAGRGGFRAGASDASC